MFLLVMALFRVLPLLIEMRMLVMKSRMVLVETIKQGKE